MTDDAKLKANRIVEALERKGISQQWSKLGIEAIRQTIIEVLGPEQPTFECLALALTEEPPDDGWPVDYREQFWAAYPRRAAKDDAIKRLDKIRKSREVAFDVIIAAVEVYRMEMQRSEMKFVALPATWLNKGRWKDDRSAIAGSHLNGRGEVKNGFLGRLME